MNSKEQDATMNLADWSGPWNKVKSSGTFGGKERTKELGTKSQEQAPKAERPEFYLGGDS